MEEGDAQLREALRYGSVHRHLIFLFATLMYAGIRTSHTGHLEEGVLFLSVAEALREKLGNRPDSITTSEGQAACQRLREHLGDTTFGTLWRQGWHTSPEEIIEQFLHKTPSSQLAPH